VSSIVGVCAVRHGGMCNAAMGVCVMHCECTCCGCTCVMSHTGMGWLRSVGSIKLYVSFAEYRLFYRALLQKRPVILFNHVHPQHVSRVIWV